MTNKKDMSIRVRFYDYVREYAKNNNGRLPSCQRVVSDWIYKSTSTASYLYEELTRLGWLEKHPRKEGESKGYYTIVGGSYGFTDSPPPSYIALKVNSMTLEDKDVEATHV